jgi:glycosyltransferase involved in cell wall biosynthesis
MNKPRIAHCLEYPIGQFGGTEILVRELVHGLSENYRIILVSADDERSIANSPIRAKLERHVTWNPSAISTSTSAQLAQSLRDAGVQLAHFHFGGNYAWGNRYFNLCPIHFVDRVGLPCMSTNHGAFSIFDGYCGPQRSVFFKGLLFPPAWLNKVRVVARLKTEIAVSQHDYRALRRWYPPMRSRFGQIYHSTLRAADQPPPVTARKKTIICVGTIGVRKGQNFLATAFSRLAAEFPDWQLMLIGRHGDAPIVEQVKRTVADNHLADRILLLDKCSDAEVKQWLKTAGIFAMPSLAEGLGLSLQEALFNGCTCIASAAGGITDLIEPEANGLLVEPGNVDQLTAGLRRLMADEPLRRRLAARAPQSILDKEMTAEKMVEKYDRIYRRILSP